MVASLDGKLDQRGPQELGASSKFGCSSFWKSSRWTQEASKGIFVERATSPLHLFFSLRLSLTPRPTVLPALSFSTSLLSALALALSLAFLIFPAVLLKNQDCGGNKTVPKRNKIHRPSDIRCTAEDVML